MNNLNGEEIEFDVELKEYDKVPEAALRELVRTCDRINILSLKEVIQKLKCFRLETEGSEAVLRENLKNSYKKILLTGLDLSLSSELLPFYVIIDFEATCEDVNPSDFRHEIIEFPAVLVNSKKQAIIDTFQMYCKPQINPKISTFCTELTGISQEQVDSAEPFAKVMEHFQNWLLKHQLGVKHKFAIVTDGPWDMSRFLYSQCHYSNVQFPKWGRKWINLQRSFSRFYKCDKPCLKTMLEFMDMKFIGRPHCGLDDAKNIARIVLQMIYDGANLQINQRISGSKNFKQKSKNEHNEAKENNDCEPETKKISRKPKIEAHYKTVYPTEQLPVYKRTRRERLIAETQLARKILKCTNKTDDCIPEKTKADAKAKPLRKC